MDDKSYVLQQCFHCGNTGLLKIVGVHHSTWGGPIYNTFGDEVAWEMREDMQWRLLACPVCQKVSLLQDYTDESYDLGENEELNFDTQLIYPTNEISTDGVPNEVQTAFEAALKVKNIDHAICLLALRRTLEAICKQQGASGKTLEAMIEHLIHEGVLPELMRDACWIIRQLGNGAAHADSTQYYAGEVNQTIGFTENIIRYLYVLPHQLRAFKSKIEESKQEEAANANARMDRKR